MNIFWLGENLSDSAQFACDQHIVKMCTEYTQILCTVLRWLGFSHESLYKSTHENHPCVLWVKESPHNFYTLWTLLNHYNFQYKTRFNKQIDHKSSTVLSTFMEETGTPEPVSIYGAYQDKGITKLRATIPPMCMPDEFKTAGRTMAEVVQAYRNYYCFDKIRMARYRTGNYPEFLVQCARSYEYERIPYFELGKKLVDENTNYRDQLEYIQRKIKIELDKYDGQNVNFITPLLKDQIKNRLLGLLPLSDGVDNIKFDLGTSGNRVIITMPRMDTQYRYPLTIDRVMTE